MLAKHMLSLCVVPDLGLRRLLFVAEDHHEEHRRVHKILALYALYAARIIPRPQLLV